MGDITRDTFAPQKHYSSVRLQQGRVQLDSEANEQADIGQRRVTSLATDVIGLCGGPQDNAAFGLTVDGNNLRISQGHYYVDGILCENDMSLLITEQLDLPGFALPNQTGKYLAYLDVWTRPITYIEDPEIREVALGGPDTTTRLQTVWQVKLRRVGNANANLNCLSPFPFWDQLLAGSSGRLRARAQPAPDSDDPCIIPPGAGFRRLENQLYRVEIHDAGNAGAATFVWSRDNDARVASVESIAGDEIKVSMAGHEPSLSFSAGSWVELTDDARARRNEQGTLVQIVRVDADVIVVDPATATGTLAAAAFPQSEHPRLRGWDGAAGKDSVTTPAANDGYLELEDGVEVRFEAGSYETGDYWLIPARTLTGDVLWPQSGGNPAAVSRHGILHHYCRLGLVTATAAGGGPLTLAVEDCRNLFPPTTELVSLFYLGGDGQEAMLQEADATQLMPLAPLRAGVSRGTTPIEGATVRFTIITGGGMIGGQAPSVDVVTDPNGVAEATWVLGGAVPLYVVQASLVGHGGTLVHLPVHYTATMPRTAKQVPFDPSNCPPLAAARTVQEAIETLCAIEHVGNGCCVTVGRGGHFPTIEQALATLLEMGETSVCLCLEPGTHEYAADVGIARLDTLAISGHRGATTIKLAKPLEANVMDSLSLTDLAIEATRFPVVLDVLRVGSTLLERVSISNQNAPNGSATVRFAECAEVRVIDSHIVGGVTRPPDITGRLPVDITDLLVATRFSLSVAEEPGQPQDDFIAEVAGRPVAERRRIVAELNEAIPNISPDISPPEEAALVRLRDLLDESRPTIGGFRELAPDLSLVGQPRASTPTTCAVQFSDGRSLAFMERNVIEGGVFFYDQPSRTRASQRSAEQWRALLLKVPFIVRGGGTFHFSGNVVDQLLFGAEWLKLLSAATDLKTLIAVFAGKFRDVTIEGNTFTSFPNELAAESLTVSSNKFQAFKDLSLISVSTTATYVGNVASSTPGGNMTVFAATNQAEEAANARITFA